MENEFYGVDFSTTPTWATPPIPTPPKPEQNMGSVPPFMPENLVVAIAYVPFQNLNTVYDPEEGFKNGTIFPELNLPFKAGGQRG